MILQKKCSNGILDFQSPPALHFEATNQGLPLTIVYTTIESTLTALRYAAELAGQLEAQIRILIIQAVPYVLPVNRPQVDPDFRVRKFLTRSANELIETRIDIRLCRDVSACLLDALPPRSLVLIGTHRRFWLTREKRWGRTLKRADHHVVFVYEDKIIKLFQ